MVKSQSHECWMRPRQTGPLHGRLILNNSNKTTRRFFIQFNKTNIYLVPKSYRRKKDNPIVKSYF
ncbi:hypothetical protein BpHYR1_047590 [Brachionus plicatilis]|uniref:Uncharacterized protein n=1 Tax=Brachionus plicatilis TaxID=10195 RepID=A0A3M7SQJ8_BRAPC|nr:hypothetical protein BpHYR1_047590 [Brachionus plicatilis]